MESRRFFFSKLKWWRPKGSSALLGRLGRHGCGVDQFGELNQTRDQGKPLATKRHPLKTRCLKVPMPLPEILSAFEASKKKHKILTWKVWLGDFGGREVEHVLIIQLTSWYRNYPSIYDRFYTSKRWLFGISFINSTNIYIIIYTRWWLQIFFIFIPILGKMNPFWRTYFSDGLKLETTNYSYETC